VSYCATLKNHSSPELTLDGLLKYIASHQFEFFEFSREHSFAKFSEEWLEKIPEKASPKIRFSKEQYELLKKFANDQLQKEETSKEELEQFCSMSGISKRKSTIFLSSSKVRASFLTN
jgi:hypothetical protein